MKTILKSSALLFLISTFSAYLSCAQTLPSSTLVTKKVMNLFKLTTAEIGDNLKLNDQAFQAWHKVDLSEDETYQFYSLKTEKSFRPIVVIIDKTTIKESN